MDRRLATMKARRGRGAIFATTNKGKDKAQGSLLCEKGEDRDMTKGGGGGGGCNTDLDERRCPGFRNRSVPLKRE